MTVEARRTALRMFPYGVHVLTARHPDTGVVAAVTVSWVTQSSVMPPLIVVALRPGNPAYGCLRAANGFVLHQLGKADRGEAFTFVRSAVADGEGRLSGYGADVAANGAPLLRDAIAALECQVKAVLEFGDHHTIVGEVTQAHLRIPVHDRPDQMMLHLADLGPTIFYGE